MKVVLKKEIYGSREQCTGLTEKPPQPQKVKNALQKKNADANVEKAVSKRVLRACLIDYNRHCNVIVISMVQLFFSLVMFLLQRIIIPYE